jgi:glycosyltransferase involved in cell wall biosynthesis
MAADHPADKGDRPGVGAPPAPTDVVSATDALLAASADMTRMVEDLLDREGRLDVLERDLQAATSELARREVELRELERELAVQRSAEHSRRQRIEELERELRKARNAERKQAKRLEKVYASTSWRLTKPLRAVQRVRPAGRARPKQRREESDREPSPAAAAFLFVSGAPEVARRYRCDHQAEQLELLGATTAIERYGEADLAEAVERHGGFVLHRVPWADDVERLIERARELGKPVLFDTDDLVFDPDVMPYVAALEDFPPDKVALYERGLHRFRRTLRACDAVVVSTEPLRRFASELHDRVVVLPNVAARSMAEAAELAVGTAGRRHTVTIGYLSGTNTHNKDLLEAADALLQALERFPDVRLLVVGPLELDPRFEAFRERIDRLPLQAWEDLPRVQALVDVNLAPLERDNPYTEGKSCIKWIEAGLAGVPTVATANPDFVRVVEDGDNGFLARSPDEWRAALELLVDDADLRRRTGLNAKRDVLAGHTTVARCGDFYAGIAAALPEREPAPLTINWVMRAPIAQNSGGYRNIFRIARILGERGHVQRLGVEAIAHLARKPEAEIAAFVDDAFGIPANAEVVLGHDRMKPADISIATHWPTANNVAAHRQSLFKGYFIQDFEPEFYEETDPRFAQAEATYRLPLRHICLGQHLANRLAGFTGVPSDVVDFALDPHFRTTRPPDERGERIRVLFFARPSLRRRGYAIGVEALRLLKAERPDVEIVFFGSPASELGEVPFEFTNLGVLDARDVASAMNDAHVLLTFSLTNISNVPYEGMACSCAVVDLDLPNVSTMVAPGENCLLAPFEPRPLADAVAQLIDDPELRLRIARRGAADASIRTWERTAGMFEDVLRKICIVQDPSLRRL